MAQLIFILLSLLIQFSSAVALAKHKDSDKEKDPPEIELGEKLFHETRFSQFFYAKNSNATNSPLPKGDVVVETLETINGHIDNPYKGQSISCAACHLVDQSKDTLNGGSRVYTDFARRSPIPDRNDQLVTTVRNSPNMVATSTQSHYFLHADGEFTTAEDLVRGGFTGRNFGWLTTEKNMAITHIANVVRNDNGQFPTDVDLKNSYPDLFLGTSSQLNDDHRIPTEYRLNVKTASDQEIFNSIARLVAAYLKSLDFSRDKKDGSYNGSPFDLFLKKNGLPQTPINSETDLQYSSRLLQKLNSLNSLKFISEEDGKFELHQQKFMFGPLELEGFKIFSSRGQCIQCHTPPDFTDHLFHNTGVAQNEFDSIHGANAFTQLPIPNLAERNNAYDKYLIPTGAHPQASGLFRSIPNILQPQQTDLGLWNIWQNPDITNPQTELRAAICSSLELNCSETSPSPDIMLSATIALFKTPTLRDLGHSAPYLHNGKLDTLPEVIDFYMEQGQLAQKGLIRNADPKLKNISLTAKDKEALAAFLKTLNEDYE